MTRAIILALVLATPASAGGLATSPIPPQRPAYAPLMEPLPANRCQHIPWTMCADGEPEGGDVQFPVQEPVQPGVVEAPPAVEKPREQDKPDTVNGPCKGVTHRFKPGC